MNKKQTIGFAVLSLVSIGSAQAANLIDTPNTQLALGGNVFGLMYAQKGQNIDATSVEISLDGKHKLRDGLYALGYVEQGLASFNSDGGTNKIKKAFVGLKSTRYGEVTLGKQDGSTNEIANFTNVLPIYGGSANNNIDVGDRSNGMVAYQNKLGGLSLFANYRFIGATTDDTAGKGESFAAKYDWKSGMSVGMGYAQQKNDQTRATDNWMFATSYTNDRWYLAALYSMGHQNTDNQYGSDSAQFGQVQRYQGYEAVVQYYVMPKWQLGTAYNLGYYQGNTRHSNRTQFVNYVAFNSTYNFNDSFSLYASYMLNLLNYHDTTMSKINTGNQLALGAEYYF